MVRGGNPLQPGDIYGPTRDMNWARNERSFVDNSQENRFQTAPVHPRPQTIEAALRDCARLQNVKTYALLILNENGEPEVYSTPSLTQYQTRIFPPQVKREFTQCSRRVLNEESGFIEGTYNEFESDIGYRKHSSSAGSSSEYRRYQNQKGRQDDSDEDRHSFSKRRRMRHTFRESSNEETPAASVTVIKTHQLRIDDEAEVEKFYAQRFKDMQQSACKVMGKAFVKLVEPKKQTHHPYTKGNGKAPPWWPPTTGENNVRHKEPDHLLKPERIRLLVHILRMIVLPPDKQCATVQKSGLNVSKLEEVTWEAMSNWFNDKDHTDNIQKKPFLKEIFKVAKLEERYRNGEIDGTTCIPVMYGERSAADDSEGEQEGPMKGEDDEDGVVQGSIGSMPTPESLVSPALGHNPQLQLDTESMMQRMRPLPVRQTSHQSMHEPFPDAYYGRNLAFQPQSPSIQDQRRSSYVQTQASFPSPQQSMYTGPWSSGMVTNAPSHNYYTTSPSTLPPASAPYIPAQHLPQQLPPLPLMAPSPQAHTFDGLPGRFDSGSGISLRGTGTSMGHNAMNQSYEGFLNDPSSFTQHDSDLKDEPHHHLHHS